MTNIMNFLSKNMNTKIITNNYFNINYSIDLGRPLFASYNISPDQINKLKYGRKRYKKDHRLYNENIYQLSPKSNIFSNNWSRGHLCPSFLMSFDKSITGAWASTYLMSNIVPQHAAFNSGSWNKLEIETYNIINKCKKPVNIIVGTSSSDIYKSNYHWYDRLNNFNYIIPNIFYQILIIDNNPICHIGINNASQKIYKVDFDILKNILL